LYFVAKEGLLAQKSSSITVLFDALGPIVA
jgi:hypothetical protein